MMVASSGEAAAFDYSFCTSVAELDDESVDADVEDVDDFVWSNSEYDWEPMTIQVDCEFEDHATSAIYFKFRFELYVDLFYTGSNEFITAVGYDNYTSNNWPALDSSGNWLNFPVVHTDTLEVQVNCDDSGLTYYRCTATCYIYNDDEEVSDFDTDVWNITMTP